MTRKSLGLWTVLIAAALPVRGAAAGPVLFVDDDAKSGGDGSSWTAAFKHVQDAIGAASESGSGVGEIRIAQGVYRPDQSSKSPLGSRDREATFRFVNGVSIRGGYQGLAARTKAGRDLRDIFKFQTILSGDLAGDDGPDFSNMEENAYHVVVAMDVDRSAALDGVTIEAGRADGPGLGAVPESKDQGSGVNVYFATPTLVDVTFRGNWASNHGAINDHGSSMLLRCKFIGNYAGLLGAGLYIHHESDTIAMNCLMQDNVSAGEGGGAYCRSMMKAMIVGCTFANNIAVDGGGLYINEMSTVRVEDCMFRANTAHTGAGTYVRFGMAQFDNCMWCGNDATLGEGGGGLWIVGGEVMVGNSTFLDNVAFNGAGVYNGNFAATVHENCVFVGNVSLNDAGGAISSVESEVLITDCVISGNSAIGVGETLGGGVSNYLSFALVDRCVFTENSSAFGGGGLYNEGGGTPSQDLFPIILSSTFMRNQAVDGGGMHNLFCEPYVANCLFVDNVAQGEGAFSWGGGMYNDFRGPATVVNCTFVGNSAGNGGGVATSTPTGVASLVNCIVQDNFPNELFADQPACMTVDHSCIPGGWDGLGDDNIDADAMFVDASKGDFHLQRGSPCLDLGDNEALTAEALVDLDGQPRIHNKIVDLGCFEFQGPPVILGDINGDGVVNGVDLGVLLSQWGNCPLDDLIGCSADLNDDGEIDGIDLGILLANWTL